MDWRHRAACLDEDPELFFPIGNTGPALLQIEKGDKSAGDARSETHACNGRWKLVRIMVFGAVSAKTNGER